MLNAHCLRWLLLTTALFLLAPKAVIADEKSSGIALALGSGGAGGLAHIAMLAEFEQRDITPDAIAGTSIGAIIGAMYAAGLSATEIRDLFDTFGESVLNPFSGFRSNGPGWTDLVRAELGNGGAFDQSGFLDFIGEHFAARSFEELKIPLQIVATNYWDGSSVVFESGDLFTALKASMAVPGLFNPVKLEDQLLIDGGISNPLPWDLLAGHELVIAIDVTGVREPNPDNSVGALDLLFKTFEVMQQSIISEKMHNGGPDIYIKPDLNGIRLLHFDRVDAVIEQASGASRELGSALDQRLVATSDDPQ
ncbi:MAG: patatin-like phospholipase family protein [Gammaproteobacteria bacterium]|nr:patatin-like phospholipase family protein [Gammaproteobacteria bacterium]